MRRWLVFFLVGSLTPIAFAQSRQRSTGAIIIQGAGDISRRPPEVWESFIRLAGGPDANFVFVPTAEGAVDLQNLSPQEFPFARLKHVTVLHTRCRSEADSETFVAPLKKANGVWFGVGRQFRLVDSYVNTRFQSELKGVLDRGGVIGGASAGGVILASYLVHSGILDQKIMVTKEYESGLDLIANSVVDQRIDTQKTEGELAAVVAGHPGLIGFGLSESTAIIVRGSVLEVIGPGRVVITDGKNHQGKRYYFLNAGEKLNLKSVAGSTVRTRR